MLEQVQVWFARHLRSLRQEQKPEADLMVRTEVLLQAGLQQGTSWMKAKVTSLAEERVKEVSKQED